MSTQNKQETHSKGEQASQPVDTKEHQTNAPIPPGNNSNNKEMGDALEKSLKADRYRKDEETNQKRRHEHEETMKDGNAPLFERAKALGGALIDGTSELTDGCKREYHSHRSKSKAESD